MARLIEPETRDYAGWSETLGDRDSRKIGNNTYVERGGQFPRIPGHGSVFTYDPEAVAIRLHRTDVVIFRPDGSIVLNSGGWRTVTTLDRINAVLPARYFVRQRKGEWYFGDRVRNAEVPFTDGFTIAPEHETTEPETPFDLVGFVIEFEAGILDDDAIVAGFQHLVDDGIVWSLQGSYGRTATALIDAGLVTP